MAAADLSTHSIQGSPDYKPFPPVVHNPSREYCADLAVWEAYNASLLLKVLEERRRCTRILQARAELVGSRMRSELLTLIARIEYPDSQNEHMTAF